MARGGGGGGGGLASKLGTGTVLTVLSALTLPIWLGALAGWAVQTAALSAVQYQQNRHFVMFDWFVTALCFVTLMLLPVNVLARRSSPGTMALLAVVAVLECLRTDVWNNARLANRGLLGQNFVQIHSITNPGLNAGIGRTRTLFAGYLITAAFCLLLLLSMGNLPAVSAQDGEFVENKARQASDNQGTGRRVGPDPYTGDQLDKGPGYNTGTGGGTAADHHATAANRV